MKATYPSFRPFAILIAVLTLFFILLSVMVFAQGKENDRVKVKIVKIVDGKTTTIEKTMDEASVKDFTKQFEDIKGKNVQVMITVEGAGKDKHSSQLSSKSSGKNNCASSMHFNFDMDSTTANAFSKMFKDSSKESNFVWNDSLMQNLPRNFNFNFNFDDEGEMNDFDFDINTDHDGKVVVIKNKGGKSIIINGDEDSARITTSESENGKTKTKTIVIQDDKSKSKKKVIVSTSVVVIDMDEEDKTRKESPKEESSFNFYPNPSDGNFVLDIDLKNKEDASIRITDMNGKDVYNEKVSGTGKTSKAINLGTDKRGTFIVTIKQGKRTSTKKIIIE
jgi:hypothetical protein